MSALVIPLNVSWFYKNRGSLADIYDLSWSPDGQFLVSGSIDNTARIWDVQAGKHFSIDTLNVSIVSRYINPTATLL